MMKFRMAAAAAALLAGTGGALAADLDNGRDDYAPDIGRAAFHGFAIGVDVGLQMTNINFAGQFDGIGADGFVGGAHAEYLFAAGQTLRVGPYVEGGLSNVNTEVGGLDLFNQEWYAGGGLKLGAVVGNTLLYLAGGIEWSQWDIAEGAADADVLSGKFAIGSDTMISDHVSLGANLSYLAPIDVEVEGHDLTDFLDKSEALVGKVKLTYHLN